MSRIRCPGGSALLLTCFAWLAACSADSPELQVVLVTGLVPGAEFASVETALLETTTGSSDVVDSVEARARFGQQYATGQAVGAFRVADGDYNVRVRLRRNNGTLLVEQNVRVALLGNYVLRVHITRDCLGVECPNSGAPENTACLQGRCVDPRCSAASPEFCPEVAFCHTASECPAVDECAEASCDEGLCVETPIEAACASTEWCNPTPGVGCEPITGPDAPFPCGTICASPNECRVAYWRCPMDASPVCEDLFNREVGHVCGDARVCDVAGTCTSCESGAPCRMGCALGAVSCDGGSPACVLDVPARYAPGGAACNDTGTCVDGQPCPTNGMCDAGGACVPTGTEPADFVVSDTHALMTSEAGSTASFTVRLASQPTSDVILEPSSLDPSEGTVSPASLTFTSLNWAAPQTITLTGVDDALADGPQTYVVRFLVTTADADYSTVHPADVSAINVDDETAGVTITPTTGLVTSESGATATFTIVLNAQPTDDVTIALHASDVDEGMVSPSSVMFTSVNWSAPQIVTVAGVDDALLDGDQPYAIVTEPASSSDASYAGIDPSDVAVSNTDNDVAGFTVGPTSGLTTTEAGGTASFTVVLNAAPSSDVVFDVATVDASEGVPDTATLTFTSADWNAPQTVTVTGVDDFVADGSQLYTVRVSPQAGSDASFAVLPARDVTLSNTDDETAGITVSPTSGLTTTEAGGTATFTLVLTSQPSSSVIVGLSSSDASEGTVSPATVTFSTATWSTPRTVTVTGVNDALADGDQIYSILTAAAVSSDPDYNGRDAANVSVTNFDDDSPAVVVGPVSGLMTSETGTTASFTVRLNTMPTASVSIPIASSDATEASVSPLSLTFTTGNWATPQTVTVTGVNDILLDGDQPYTIVLSTCTSTDATYAAINPTDVMGTNTDTTTCPMNTRACGGVCAACPTDPNVTATGCSGNACVPTACIPWYRPNGAACLSSQTAYLKASNPDGSDSFGSSIALSGDGHTAAVSAYLERSNATGVGGNQLDNSLPGAGAVYVFRLTGTTWAQEAYVKASNTDASDMFAWVSLSANGDVLVVGAGGEDSSATGVNGLQTNTLPGDGSGAVYVFRRTGTSWAQEAYIKASNTGNSDGFSSLSISADGTVLAVGAPNESSNAIGVGGNQADNSANYAGAVYVFRYAAGLWSQEAYIKASNPETGDTFGTYLSLSDDGQTLVVAAPGEDSNAHGVGGNQANNSSSYSGALYVFRWTAGVWAQEAYIKTSNADPDDGIGRVSVSADGNRFVCTSVLEMSNATGVGGNQLDNSVTQAGAAYVFERTGTSWAQIAYLKSATGTMAQFGYSAAISDDGATVVVGSDYESPPDRPAAHIGLVYIFHDSGAGFTQQAIVRALNADPFDYLGTTVAISGDASTILSGATQEASNASGVDGDSTDNSLLAAGAVYVFSR